MTALSRLMRMLGNDAAAVVVQMARSALAAGKAVFTGVRVSEDRILKRVQICDACPLVLRKTSNGKAIPYACGQCGCAVKPTTALFNLAAYEETDSYGCKHPDGSKWAKEGV